MKVKDLKKLLEELPDEMEIVKHESLIPEINVEMRTLGDHPKGSLYISSPIDYDRYQKGEGRFTSIAISEGLRNIRKENCLVIL